MELLVSFIFLMMDQIEKRRENWSK